MATEGNCAVTINFDELEFEPSDQLFDQEPPDPELIEREQYDEPDKNFFKGARRKPGSADYENKVKSALNDVMRICIASPTTEPDAAALIMYGSQFSRAMGDLAAENEWVRKGIDFVAGGTTSPIGMAIATGMPLVLQILRNHESKLKADIPTKRIKIPFTKRYLTIKLRVNLGKRLRNMTNDPQEFRHWVLDNPAIREALKKQGIQFGASE